MILVLVRSKLGTHRLKSKFTQIIYVYYIVKSQRTYQCIIIQSPLYVPVLLPRYCYTHWYLVLLHVTPSSPIPNHGTCIHISTSHLIPV